MKFSRNVEYDFFLQEGGQLVVGVYAGQLGSHLGHVGPVNKWLLGIKTCNPYCLHAISILYMQICYLKVYDLFLLFLLSEECRIKRTNPKKKRKETLFGHFLIEIVSKNKEWKRTKKLPYS